MTISVQSTKPIIHEFTWRLNKLTATSWPPVDFEVRDMEKTDEGLRAGEAVVHRRKQSQKGREYAVNMKILTLSKML